MSEFHVPESARGVRWNDPAFAIQWPEASERIINARDSGYPDFNSLSHPMEEERSEGLWTPKS